MLRALVWLLVFLTVLMATELRPSHGEPRNMVAVPLSTGNGANATSRRGPVVVKRPPIALPASGSSAGR